MYVTHVEYMLHMHWNVTELQEPGERRSDSGRFFFALNRK